MSKLLHSSIFWCIAFLLGSGLALWFLLTYLMKWYQANPGYLDVMASAVVTVLIIPFFIVAAYIALRAVLSDVPTYVQLALGDFTARAASPRRSPAKS